MAKFSTKLNTTNRPVSTTRKTKLRLDELLVTATRLFNTQGFLSTRMDEISSSMQATPGSLYHYVESKEELAYRCYLRSCDIRRAQLEHANDPENSGLENICDFFGNVLADHQSRTAIVGELNALKPVWANRIRRLQRTNVEICQKMVLRGVNDGSIGTTNPHLTGIALMGIIEWISFWYTNRLPQSKQDITDSMIDIVTNGVSLHRTFDVDIPKIESVFTQSTSDDKSDSKDISNIKLQQFLRVALVSFNRNGVKATSIDEIASQLNVTKGAFYHYFKNKDELLYHCYERAITYNKNALEHICVLNYHQREVLARRSLFERHVSEAGPFPAYLNLRDLSPGRKSQVLTELGHMLEKDQQDIIHGIETNEFRPVDPVIAEKVRAGLINWYPIWYSPEGRASASEIADNHSNIFLNGLKPRPN